MNQKTKKVLAREVLILFSIPVVWVAVFGIFGLRNRLIQSREESCKTEYSEAYEPKIQEVRADSTLSDRDREDIILGLRGKRNHEIYKCRTAWGEYNEPDKIVAANIIGLLMAIALYPARVLFLILRWAIKTVRE